MAGEPTTAIVLRTVEFSETSLIVTLLTRDFGRVSAMAKGARRPKGPFEGSLDLLAVCRVMVYRRNADVLDLLTEAKLQRRFRGAEKSLTRTYGGYYLAEMLRLLTDDHDPHEDLYDLALETLGAIDSEGNVAGALLRFDAQALSLLGHAPGTDSCTACGKPVQWDQRVAYSLRAGGVVCKQCKSRQHQLTTVRRSTIDLLNRLRDRSCAVGEPIDRALYRELRAILNRTIEELLGKSPRMQSHLPADIE